MTPEAQRIAIAEACGWDLVPNYAKVGLYGYHRRQTSYDVAEYPPGAIPDYSTSLDAMHEAEKVLTPAQQAQYAMTLHEAHGIPLATFWHRVICSTAAQRAEAFLRVLNLWKETTT